MIHHLNIWLLVLLLGLTSPFEGHSSTLEYRAHSESTGQAIGEIISFGLAYNQLDVRVRLGDGTEFGTLCNRRVGLSVGDRLLVVYDIRTKTYDLEKCWKIKAATPGYISWLFSIILAGLIALSTGWAIDHYRKNGVN